ncbi:shock factor protein [Seminavis robusta]|uniref:Shock factor protein n=1 Tax=Seminavis robusta TaxID=568900 RepID=A0A9N8D612_9STRA|nr:shock factor protein [Seminavis robusta]|eukprot:Sro9_g007300.1 shock factor protein (393) ;mRNA; f:108242-109940
MTQANGNQMNALYLPTFPTQVVQRGARAPAPTTAGPAEANLSTMLVPFVDDSEHKVVHNYHDHASDPDGDYAAQQLVQQRGGPGVEQSFPMKLHYLLNDLEQDGLSHIVSWQPHGRCFVVHNQKAFVDQILGCWFRQSKIASFQRQLNIYGFQRLTTGPDKGGYYHELFLRSKPGLASRIQRHKLKGTKTRRAASPESEPNFYLMTPMPVQKKPTVVAPTAPVAATVVPKSCSVSSYEFPSSTLDTKTSSASDALTLQKIVPSLFSPATFETTVHHQLVPQYQRQQQLRQPRGLTVTSTCSVTVKPTEGFDMASAGGVSGPFSFPFTLTQSSQATNSNGVAGGPTTNRNNEALWAALSGGAPMPMAPSTDAGNHNMNNNAHNTGGSSLWLLR